MLAMLAEQQPAVFETYQSTHSQQAEATLKSRAFMASFLACGNASLTFIGLYRQAGWVDMSGEDFDQSPSMQTMYRAFSSEGFVARGIERRARFDLQPISALADLRGRLIVADPGARAYMRRAETTGLQVLEIQRVPDLAPPMPNWQDLTLDANTMRSIPRTWADTLRHWRGIYLIVDESDGARYVGAAYGENNILGRWQTHLALDSGVTRELAQRDTANFRFSILELLSPAATVEQVTQLEHTWMDRLHTRRFGLNA